jgi:hypothetical protein
VKKSLVAAGFAVLLVAAPASTANYRYAGWVETIGARNSGFADFPTHSVYAHGAGFTLGFYDGQTPQPSPFKVCLAQKAAVRKCWTSTAWPVKRIKVTQFFRVGFYVVKWYVGGRVVATWPLHLYGEDA